MFWRAGVRLEPRPRKPRDQDDSDLPPAIPGLCNARLRSRDKVARCKLRPVKPGGRCRLHGGLSTGPRTSEGKARNREAVSKSNRERAARRRSGTTPKSPKWPGAPMVEGDDVLEEQFIIRKVLARIRRGRDPKIMVKLAAMAPEARAAFLSELVAAEMQRLFVQKLRRSEQA